MAWRYTIEASRLRGWLLWRSVLFSQDDHGSYSRSLHSLFIKLKRPTGVARLITMQGKHTWTAPERQRAQLPARGAFGVSSRQGQTPIRIRRRACAIFQR